MLGISHDVTKNITDIRIIIAVTVVNFRWLFLKPPFEYHENLSSR